MNIRSQAEAFIKDAVIFSKMKHKSFIKNIIVLGALAILLGIFFHDVIFSGKTFKISTGNPQTIISGVYGQEDNSPKYFTLFNTDVPCWEEGVYEFIKLSLHKGIIPLWNPHLACGYPLIGFIQVGMFYPLNLILYLLPNAYSYDVLILLRMFLGSVFVYWFMRVLKFKELPSFVSAMIYLLFPTIARTQAWVVNVDILAPLVFIGFEKFLQRPCRRTWGLLALFIAGTFYGGHPEHIVPLNIYASFFYFFRVATCYRRFWKRSILPFLGVYILALALSAMVFLPFFSNWSTEFWHTRSLVVGNIIARFKGDYIFNRKFLITVLLPHFFQKEPVTLSFDQSGLWLQTCLIPLVLYFAGLFGSQKKKLNYFFAALAVFIFCKSYIPFPPFIWVSYLPVIRDIRFAEHSVHLFAFVVSVCAGIGARYIMTRKKFFVKGLLFNLFILSLFAWALFHFRAGGHFTRSLHAVLFGVCVLLAWQAVLLLKDIKFLKRRSIFACLVLLIAVEFYGYIPRDGWVKRFESFPKVPYIEFIKHHPGRNRIYGIYWTMYPNTAAGYDLDDFGILHGFLMKRYVNFVNKFIMPDYFKKDMGRTAFHVFPATMIPNIHDFFDMLNLRYTVGPNNPMIEMKLGQKLKLAYPRIVYNNEVKVYEHPGAFNRAFIVHRAIFAQDTDDEFQKIAQIRKDFDLGVVIEHEPEPEILSTLSNVPLADESSARILKYTPNEVVVSADMKNPGFLVLSDAYHPDWHAYVYGKKTEVYPANFFVRAVYLDRGVQVVRFKFEPGSFYSGVKITAVSFALLLVLLLIPSFVKKKRNEKPFSRLS